ncbi:hypothetical protein JOC37_000319 [Desulfohalotomaculum tongense]|uniref:hypothetical protein n=1 Tax=Desulforadius tongensis TaxID=1216062 RepID=UPI00195675A3|nr:hypothetical protein [Desulforadius tongensis]MBM7853954.1 hypothetical protein [Desulforadius tongensis]
MIFVRTGPRFLFLRTPDTGGLKDVLVKKLSGLPVEFTEAIETAGESDTIVLVIPKETGKAKVSDARYIVLLPIGSSVTLSKLINLNLGELLTAAELGAGLLVQRLPQNNTKVIDMIKEDYRAQALGLVEAINLGGADDTVLVFTGDRLQKTVEIEKVIEPCLLIHQPIPQVYTELRREAVRYFTRSLENSEWYEVRINIYDADENYEIHARRLELVLEDLEAGLILAEIWTRDHALALFSVAAYQIRLFTMIEPLELKTLLMGLEYNEQGQRFVDMDLYHRRSKIDWGTIAKKSPFGRRKSGLHYRRQLYSRLSSKTVKKLLALEKELENAE